MSIEISGTPIEPNKHYPFWAPGGIAPDRVVIEGIKYRKEAHMNWSKLFDRSPVKDYWESDPGFIYRREPTELDRRKTAAAAFGVVALVAAAAAVAFMVLNFPVTFMGGALLTCTVALIGTVGSLHCCAGRVPNPNTPENGSYRGLPNEEVDGFLEAEDDFVLGIPQSFEARASRPLPDPEVAARRTALREIAKTLHTNEKGEDIRTYEQILMYNAEIDERVEDPNAVQAYQAAIESDRIADIALQERSKKREKITEMLEKITELSIYTSFGFCITMKRAAKDPLYTLNQILVFSQDTNTVVSKEGIVLAHNGEWKADQNVKWTGLKPENEVEEEEPSSNENGVSASKTSTSPVSIPTPVNSKEIIYISSISQKQISELAKRKKYVVSEVDNYVLAYQGQLVEEKIKLKEHQERVNSAAGQSTTKREETPQLPQPEVPPAPSNQSQQANVSAVKETNWPAYDKLEHLVLHFLEKEVRLAQTGQFKDTDRLYAIVDRALELGRIVHGRLPKDSIIAHKCNRVLFEFNQELSLFKKNECSLVKMQGSLYSFTGELRRFAKSVDAS